MKPSSLSPRAYSQILTASSWEEIWEAGPYFDRISELLEDAKHYAVFVGWQIDSRLPLKRPDRPDRNSNSKYESSETLKEKVIRICEEKPQFQIYFLFWDHAYFYIFEREVWQGRVWENIHPRVHFVFDNRHPLGGSHHEKVCIIDGRIAFCGGIDLCDERWDSPYHLYFDPRRSLTRKAENHGPYHDLAVQVTGPICGEIHKHIQKRWKILSSINFPEPILFNPPSVQSSFHRVYLSRTMSELERIQKKKTFTREVEFLFRDLILSAEKRIILEGQYFWSEAVNDLLVSKIHEMSGKDFEVYVILAVPQMIKSLTRYMTPYEMSLIRRLTLAAEFSKVRVIVGSPYSVSTTISRVLPPKPIYIHSKVCVIDDRYLSIGSANFAARALRIDTETNLTFEAQNKMEQQHIERVAQSILKHWNLNPVRDVSGVSFRILKPRPELWHLDGLLHLTRHFRWQKVIDPKVPWFYFLKIYFRKRFYQSLGVRSVLFGIIILFSFEAIQFLVGESILVNHWAKVYAIFLSLSWILPLPFLLTVLLASLKLGIYDALRIGVSALWVASFVGYSLARVYPESLSRLFLSQSQTQILEKLGKRNFTDLVYFLLDPRIEIRSKIISQGLYSVPLPWFIFGTGVLFPAAVFNVVRWIWALVILIFPGNILEIISRHLGIIFIFICIWSLGRLVASLWRNLN